MQIRKSQEADLEQMLAIYEYARGYMKENGNPSQWGDTGYPKEELLREDIALGRSYVAIDEDGEICATFVYFIGEDATYGYIEGTGWLNDKPYGVIHRIAKKNKHRKILEEVLQFCFEQCANLRIDTHQDNHIMQHLLEKNGFSYCGQIYLADKSLRLAYQKEHKAGK